MSGSFLHHFAEANEVETLGDIMVKSFVQTQNESSESTSDLQLHINELGDNFLHTFARKHSLEDLLGEINKQNMMDGNSDKMKPENTNPYSDKENRFNRIAECFKMKNKKGNTVLAVAVNSAEGKAMESSLLVAMQRMTVLFGEEAVATLCKEKDDGGTSLLHIAVQKSFPELLSYIISKTPNGAHIFNEDGYNPLHLAAQTEIALW